MFEFWEETFKSEKMIWGQEPSNSAIIIKDFFLEHNVSDILIPGIGYGRNAKVFYDNAINVTGIEISKSAIELAQENISKNIVSNLEDASYYYSLTDCENRLDA